MHKKCKKRLICVILTSVFIAWRKVINTNRWIAFLKNIFVRTFYLEKMTYQLWRFLVSCCDVLFCWIENKKVWSVQWNIYFVIKYCLLAFLHWNIMTLQFFLLYTTYRNNTNINNLGLSQIVISLSHVQFKEKAPNCLTGKLYNVVEIMEPHHEMRWMHIHYIQLCQEYEKFSCAFLVHMR